MTGIGTLWRTIRHLRSEQIIGRLQFRLRHPNPDLRPPPPPRPRVGAWVTPAMREPSLVAPGRFRLLNEEYDLDRLGWDDPSTAKLLRYNVHYFDDLNARGFQDRGGMHRDLMTRWIENNPPARGTGWEPYPVSLRMVNWIKWLIGGATADATWLHSLAVQARWLRRRLEVHLLGNHLFANAKALVFAGLFFEGEEADQWLRDGLNIVEREIPEQILADGGHFERSPMYHALALEDLLDLINVSTAYGAGASASGEIVRSLRAHASRMLYWLRCMVHPDETVGLFNDSADGIAPSLRELERYATQLGVSASPSPGDAIVNLSASGYIRVSRGRALALLDVAPVGPDYLPGHAHADTLSFELSLGRQRVIVNGGTSCYGTSAQRLRERGTAAHSTVQVADQDSSEVWSGFRVGRRARPTPAEIDGWEVRCAHDGYRHLPGRPMHRRRWHFGMGELVVEDEVTPARQHAVARYILAPGLQLRPSSSDRWELARDSAVIAVVEISQGRAIAERASHAPRFGVSLPVDCLAVTLSDGRAATRWTWTDDAHPVPDR